MGKMKKPVTPYTIYLVLALVVLFHAVLGIRWLAQNQALQGSDEIDYLQNLERFERAWPEDWDNVPANLKILTGHQGFTASAPLPFLIAKASFALLDRKIIWARVQSLAAYLLLIVVVFLLGKQVSGPWGGLLAATIFASFPFAMVHARFFNAFSLNALMIALTVLVLMKSGRLHRAGYMMLFGIVLGLALITERGTPAIVLAGPIAGYCINTFFIKTREHPANWSFGRAVLLLIMAGVIAYLIGGRYVLDYFHISYDYNMGNINVPIYPERNTPEFFLQKGQSWILTRTFAVILLIASILVVYKHRLGRKILAGIAAGYLLSKAVNWPWDYFFWAGTFFCALVFADFKHKWALLGWIFVPLIVFSTFATKDIEYVYSVMPALGVALSAMILWVADNKKRKVALAVLMIPVIAFSALQAVAISFSNPAVRALYEKFPPAIRFANGTEKFYPLKSQREKTARQIVDALPVGKGGLLIYLPGDWSGDFAPNDAGGYLPDRNQWAMSLQVWIEWLRPGLDHFLISGEVAQALSWTASNEDMLIFYPMDEVAKARFQYNAFQNTNPIRVLMTQATAGVVFTRIHHLPGEPIARLPVFSNRTLYLMQAGQKTVLQDPVDE